jgi:hypothetical protein
MCFKDGTAKLGFGIIILVLCFLYWSTFSSEVNWVICWVGASKYLIIRSYNIVRLAKSMSPLNVTGCEENEFSVAVE